MRKTRYLRNRNILVGRIRNRNPSRREEEEEEERKREGEQEQPCEGPVKDVREKTAILPIRVLEGWRKGGTGRKRGLEGVKST